VYMSIPVCTTVSGIDSLHVLHQNLWGLSYSQARVAVRCWCGRCSGPRARSSSSQSTGARHA
jgi:hypothetical protein